MPRAHKFTEVEDFYLVGNYKVPVADIAKKLGLTEKAVAKRLLELNPSANEPVKEEPKYNRATVMTEAQSSLPAEGTNSKLQQFAKDPTKPIF